MEPSELAQLYDGQFFAEYGNQNPRYAGACRFIADEIYRRFQPATAVDWGCGAGLHAAALADHGVTVIAVDGVAVSPPQRADIPITVADLTRPVADLAPPGYDLSLCIDVLEHIDEGHSATVLENITRGARMLLLSCAPPGQGGHHHVNEQPRRYWIARLAAIGWQYQRRETGELEQFFLAHRQQVPDSWMYHNLCIYRPIDAAG